MTGRLSIRARLAAAFTAALVLVLALTATFVYLRVADDLNRTIDDGLRTRADDLAALASADRLPDLASGRLVEGDEGFAQITTPRGRVLASTLSPGTGGVLSRAEAERAAGGSVRIEARDVRGIDGGARILARSAQGARGQGVVVVVGATLEDRKESLAGLLSAFLIGAPLALVLSGALGYVLAGRALAPVERMRSRAAEVTLARSGERLPLPPADDEIRQLGETLNAMLDRIEASLEREREFVADASHELRTPLAVLRTELELADRSGRSPEQLRAAVHSASEEVERLSQLAEDLLVIARSDQGRLPVTREAVHLDELLERVRSRFARRAAADGREIVVEAAAAEPVQLDPLRIEQALGNLVDNALRHGAGQVRVRAEHNGTGTVLEVGDQGRGFETGFEARAFERFTRADEGREGGGAGLGLPIARAIAQAHGGDIRIAPPAGGGGGAHVRITIPA